MLGHRFRQSNRQHFRVSDDDEKHQLSRRKRHDKPQPDSNASAERRTGLVDFPVARVIDQPQPRRDTAHEGTSKQAYQ
jgi:hypothetical protein